MNLLEALSKNYMVATKLFDLLSRLEMLKLP